MSMSVEKLDKIIKRFWAKEGNNTIWHTGYCSEVAVALDTFLKGQGQIGKQSWFHTIYIYKGAYCDIRGCMDEAKMDFHNPIGAQGKPTPAKPEELHHIYSLLNKERTKYVIRGLKQAQKELSNA